MERSDIIQRMKSKTTTIDLFNYDTLTAPPLLSLLTYEDIEYFRQLATSIRYSAKIDFKYSEIDRIMKMRGFKKIGGGTNRVVYRHLEIDTIVVKIAIDNIGIKDNPREYKNQFYLKPYVTKVFEVSPCGTVGLFERCDQVNSREEFKSIASEVYDLLSNWIIGKYVMEDIGSMYFMNYCVRPGFGPVLCDFPYLYELDGNKLYCSIPDERGFLCDGIIDYDEGFNHLYCSKCGVKYKAIELKKAIDNKLIINKEKENEKMVIEVLKGKKVIKKFDTTNESRKFESVVDKKYRNVESNNMNCVFVNKDTGKEIKNTISTNVGEVIDSEEILPFKFGEEIEREEDEYNNKLEFVINNKKDQDDIDYNKNTIEIDDDNDLYEIDEDDEIIISNAAKEFLVSIKNDVFDSTDVMTDITVSLRERDGVNIFTEDYNIDGEKADPELILLLNSLKDEINDILYEYEEDKWTPILNILNLYSNVFSSKIKELSDKSEDDNNYVEESNEDFDGIDGSYDDGEDDNYVEETQNEEESNEDSDIVKEVEVEQKQQTTVNSFICSDNNTSENDIPVGAVPRDHIQIGKTKYNRYNNR